MRAVKVAGSVALWAMQILAAAAFVAIGLGKFGGTEWASRFERWGYPDGFYLVIGALEVAGGLLLLLPKTTSHAAGLIGVILAGAAATHALHGESARIAAPLMWMAVMAGLAWARRRRAWRPGRPPVPVPANQV